MATTTAHTPPQSFVGSLGEPAPAHRPDEARIDGVSPSSSTRNERAECEPRGRRASSLAPYSFAVAFVIAAVALFAAGAGQFGGLSLVLAACSLGTGAVMDALWAAAERARQEGA